MASKYIEGLAVEIAWMTNESLGQLARELVARHSKRADYLDMMIKAEFQEQLMAYNERQARKQQLARAIAKDIVGA
jgi:hypothetical protein